MLKLLLVFLNGLLFSLSLTEHITPEDFIKKFQQHDYEVIYEHMELVSYDEKYVVKEIQFKTFKFNRTCTAFNVSLGFKDDIGSNLDVIVQAYRFASNEYRLFPIRFQLNFCDVVAYNVFGMGKVGLSKCEMFTGCPFQKGKTYHFCNLVPDASQFPPYIPSGRYKCHAEMVHGSESMFTFAFFLEVTRPFHGR